MDYLDVVCRMLSWAGHMSALWVTKYRAERLAHDGNEEPKRGALIFAFSCFRFFPLSFREWAETEESPRKHYIRYKNLCLPYVASQTLGEEWERKSQPWRTKRVFPASSLCSQPIRLEIKGSAHQCGFQGPCSVSWKRLKMSDTKSSHKNLCPWKFSYCLLEEEITSTAPPLPQVQQELPVHLCHVLWPCAWVQPQHPDVRTMS